MSTLFQARSKLFVFAALFFSAAASADVPVVAAASSVKFALEEIAESYKADTNKSVRLVFGSSGNLVRQIMQGAPFEIFLSADEIYVSRLEQNKKTSGTSKLYARGRLALFAPKSAGYKVDDRANGLRVAINQKQIKRFAIANPEHAPYGRAARQALESLKLWSDIKTVLVLGENVSQAAQFAAGGSTQGGIFAYSLALLPQLSEQGDYVLLAEELHEPLNHYMVLTDTAGDTAQSFFDYVLQPEAKMIFERHGFSAP